MSTSHLDPKICFRLLVVTLFVAGASLWGFSDIALAEQTQQELYPNPEAERWVLEQVEAGKVADLKERFSDKKDRVLSADFIEKLLTGEFEDAPVHRRGVRIKHALFTEPLDLVNAEVRCETKLDYCQFETKVDLSWSHFHRVLSFEHSKFNNAEEGAYFGHMTVGGLAFFKEAVFAGPVNFRYAQIDGNFVANGAKFNNPDKVAYFVEMTVGGTAFFKEAVFAGPVDFSDVEFLILNIQDTSWPAKSESVILHRMTYKHIDAGTEKDTWQELLAWVDGSKYSGQPYVQLEEFFRAAGYPERADTVFIARKQRERSEALEGLTVWWNLFLDLFVGYGRKPERVLVLSLLVVLLGALPFRRREYMEPQKREYASRPYNPFWYSLDLFLPVVDLRMAKVWMPRQDRRFARQYARVQIIMGWILIPLGLAAIMGIIQ